MKKTLIILVLIFLLGVILRFFNLGQIPAGFHRDEAYFGYSAYSLIKTGMDMTGNFLPLNLESFLHSPAGYSYLSISFILIFGLNEFSVRFAAALFGSLTVILTYFLAYALFEKNKSKDKIALFSAFLIAISPWNINLARTATENVIVVFLIALGIMLYKKWLEKDKLIFICLSIASFLISLYTYQAPRSFLPIFLPLIFIYFSFKNKRKLFISFIVYAIFIILPVLSILFSHDLSQRIRMLSIFNSPSSQLILDEQLREDGVMNIAPIEARVFHNKIISYSNTFVLNYMDHFSFRFLFTDSGLPDRYRVPGMGLLYLFEIPIILVGAYSLFNKNRKLFMLLLGWILIAPIGSALTYDDIPNLQRTLLVFPALSIISGFGILNLLEYINSIKLNKNYILGIKCLIIIVISYSILFYLYSYYVTQVAHRPWYRQEGYKTLIEKINSLDKTSNYKKIVITESQTDPAIFFIFYNNIEPKFVQNLFKTASSGDFGNLSFNKYNFSADECPLKEVIVTDPKTLVGTPFIKGQKGFLYVDSGTCKIPKNGIKVLDIIKRKDQTTVFLIMQVEEGAKIYNDKSASN